MLEFTEAKISGTTGMAWRPRAQTLETDLSYLAQVPFLCPASAITQGFQTSQSKFEEKSKGNFPPLFQTNENEKQISKQ